MKKFSLLVLTFLLCMGFAQAQDVDEAELEAFIQAYKAMKAAQAPAPKKKVDPELRMKQALMFAARDGNTAQIRGLLEQGVDPNIEDTDGYTPLTYAALKGDLAAVDMLLFAGAKVDVPREEQMPPILAALANKAKNKDVFYRILKEKPNVNAVYCQKAQNLYQCATTLMFATESNDVQMVEALIKQGADVNKYTAPRGTALNWALAKNTSNSAKIVEVLLKAGASPWFADGYSKTPLKLAKISKDKEKIQLIKAAKKATKKQYNKSDDLYFPVYFVKLKKIKKLLDEGADPNARSDVRHGIYSVEDMAISMLDFAAAQPMLIVATHQKQDNIVSNFQLLLDAGADVNAVDGKGNTVLHTFLCDKKNPKDVEAIPFLLKHGANINARNVYGHTPLFRHILRGRNGEQTVRQLLEEGADPNIRNIYGISPLMYAKRNYNTELANLLEQYGAKLTKQDEAENEKWFAQQEIERVKREQKAAAQNQQDAAFAQGLLNVIQMGLTR